jgi:hypothetical protein
MPRGGFWIDIAASCIPALLATFFYHLDPYKSPPYQGKGVEVTGHVVTAYVTAHDDKRPNTYDIEYIYEVDQPGKPLALLQGAMSITRTNYGLSKNQPVPVIYDPTYPADSVLDTEAMDGIGSHLFCRGGACALLALSIWLILKVRRKYLKAKQLLMWGKVARAEITVTDTYSVKGVSKVDIDYHFIDNNGTQRMGMVIGTFPSSVRLYESVGTVVFDPQDSSDNHSLYPVMYVSCE